MNLFAAILAGGAGKRFWPQGRRKRPKPFLPLLEGKSLLRNTWERVRALCPADQILVVGSGKHRHLLRRELPELPAANLLLEPVSRDTAAAVALAAIAVRKRGGDVPLLIAPADHFIGDTAAFGEAIRKAEPLLPDHLITFGVRAATPETAYGYIEAGKPVPGTEGFRVRKFIEKPTREGADRLLKRENMFWNSGIFLWSTEKILAAIGEHLSFLGEKTLETLDRAMETGDDALLKQTYEGLETISIDHGVLEKAADLAVFPVRFPWSDLGSWSLLGPHLPGREGGNRSLGKLVAVDSTGNIVVNPGGITGLIGIQDLCVVYAEGALLVCTRDRSQEVKTLVEALEKAKEEEFL